MAAGGREEEEEEEGKLGGRARWLGWRGTRFG